MTIEEAIYARITAALGALIGTRCYPLVIPQDASLPAVTYQIISSAPQITHSGSAGIVETRVQFTIAADEYAQTKAVDLALRALFDGVTFEVIGGPAVMLARVDNALDDFEAVNAEPFARCDVILWHTPSI